MCERLCTSSLEKHVRPIKNSGDVAFRHGRERLIDLFFGAGVDDEQRLSERYRRRESSVEEALIEMYLAGVSVRRVEDITEALWGTRVSPSTVSDLNKKIYGTIEAWRNRPIEGEHPYVYLDGIVLKRSWAGEVRNVSLLVAIGVKARDIGRYSASARAPRRTRRAGARSSSISRSAV